MISRIAAAPNWLPAASYPRRQRVEHGLRADARTVRQIAGNTMSSPSVLWP
jgi:hypothetical protein